MAKLDIKAVIIKSIHPMDLTMMVGLKKVLILTVISVIFEIEVEIQVKEALLREDHIVIEADSILIEIMEEKLTIGRVWKNTLIVIYSRGKG
jgi:hypothetical protein